MEERDERVEREKKEREKIVRHKENTSRQQSTINWGGVDGGG